MIADSKCDVQGHGNDRGKRYDLARKVVHRKMMTCRSRRGAARKCRLRALPARRAPSGPALAGYGAEAVRDAIASTITTLPVELRRSLTWDRGKEMAKHAQLRVDTGLAIYFCDPQSPWQRGTNENTNGLLRQYFPKGTDLSKHSADELGAVAAALNGRPRKTLGWQTPAEALDELLRSVQQDGVATTR